VIAAGQERTVGPWRLYLEAGQAVVWVNRTALAAGDDVWMNQIVFEMAASQ
jgi:hypothetical protein